MHAHEHPRQISSLVRPEVADLPRYDPGADPDSARTAHGLSHIAKLSNNENPFGFSAAVGDALRPLTNGLGTYPDPSSRHLRTKLAERLGVSIGRITIGNGSENILELLCQAFIGAGDRVVTQSPCFGLHEIFPLMMGGRVDKVPLSQGFSFDSAAWQQALAQPTKMVLISNPSNPVGTVIESEEFLTLVDAAPKNALLVIDEAYFEYAEGDTNFPDALSRLAHQPRPWMVLRTFSKAYGLASLRIGYGIASHDWLVEILDRVRTPYNVNGWAQCAALAALSDQDHVKKGVALIAHERIRLSQLVRNIGLAVAPSHTNFLFIDTGRNAVGIANDLLRQGVIVKPWREHGFESFIRMSLGTPDDNDFFFQALCLVLNHHPA